MKKFLISFKRPPEMPIEAFRDHWATVHAKNVSRLPGIGRYVQSTAHDSAYSRGREPVFDALGELWFDDDWFDGLAASAEYAVAREDASTFTDRSSTVCLPVEDVPLIDGPHAPLKLVMFVRRRPDLTTAQFRAHWLDVHGPIAVRNPFMRRYVQLHTPAAAAVAPPASYDGVGMVWFDTMEDLRASGATPAAVEAGKDGPRFAEGGAPAATLLTSETLVLA